MAATMQQFMKEVSPLLKFHYEQNRNSRASYKSAVEALAVTKMPSATELARRQFVLFALNAFDLMRASGLDPNSGPEKVAQRMGIDKPRRPRPILPIGRRGGF